METTKQFRKRNAILACLRGTTCHPSAEKLYQMLQQEHPDISLATVYRNLALFKSQGIIASVATVGGVERFDGNIEPHVHFICSGCGAVLDVEDFLVSNLFLPLGSLVYLLFCVTRWGWNFDNYLAEGNTGSGFKMPCWLKNYFRFALPVLILVILVQGL